MYDALPLIYDRFNDDFDYEKYINTVFAQWQLPSSGLLLDCGCGTGELLCRMVKRGYDCTGLDASPRMLDAAREKLGDSVNFVCQSLPEIDLYGAYDIVFCTQDTVNHITDMRSLKRFFCRMYNFVEPGGVFVFDIRTRRSFEKADGRHIYERDGDIMLMNCSFGGTYALYDFTLFEKGGDGRFDMQTDYVEERFYEPQAVKRLLASAKFTFCGRKKYGDRLIYCYRKNNC